MKYVVTSIKYQQSIQYSVHNLHWGFTNKITFSPFFMVLTAFENAGQ